MQCRLCPYRDGACCTLAYTLSSASEPETGEAASRVDSVPCMKACFGNSFVTAWVLHSAYRIVYCTIFPQGKFELREYNLVLFCLTFLIWLYDNFFGPCCRKLQCVPSLISASVPLYGVELAHVFPQFVCLRGTSRTTFVCM